jgi:rod shape-determining protein MreC
MENLITRYRNVTVLVAVLFAQVLGLAIQVKRTTENQSTRLIRIWTVDAITPLEKGIVRIQHGGSNLWHSYFYLRGVRQENRELKQQIEQLHIEQARLSEDAGQAHRLQALLSFKEQFISKTVAAQVIGSSGSEQSRSIYIDKGAREGIKQDMAVITADGVVGKVLRVFGGKPLETSVSQVLLINDQTSGVGAILEKSRLQGVLRGTPSGEVILEKVMSDEAVQPGDKVLTSGGDQIFPKGLPVGTVTKVFSGQDLFLNIRVKPIADLSRLEEVLVVTQEQEIEPTLAEGAPHVRAADILAQRLPSVPDKPATDPTKLPGQGVASVPKPVPGVAVETGSVPKTTTPQQKPAGTNAGVLPRSAAPSPLHNVASNSAGSTKPASVATVKPATGTKPPPPAVNISQKTAQPAATTPKLPAQTEPAATTPPEDNPQ